LTEHTFYLEKETLYMLELTINTRFRDATRPLKPDEFKALEESIVRDGMVHSPIITWKNQIVDGHNRWSIIQKHPEISYTVKEMDFPDEWTAEAWICSIHMCQQNLTNEERTYLIGKLYSAQKKSIRRGGINYAGTDNQS